MSSCLFECLKEAGLERYYHPIQRRGFETAFSLLYLPPAELRDVGITTDIDRQRFLQLVQIIASFHQGGQLSPKRVLSPPRTSTQSRSNSGRPRMDTQLADSMTNSLLLGYQSSDSTGTSQESPPDYIPSPRRRNKPSTDVKLSVLPTKRNSASGMERPTTTSPTKHKRQQKKRNSNESDALDAISQKSPFLPVSRARRVNSDLQSVAQQTPNTSSVDRNCYGASVDNMSSASQSIRMSAESLKVHKVFQTKGYNYGLPRDDPRSNAVVANSPKMTRAEIASSPMSQRARQNANVQPSRPKITVCVRKRPILEGETRNGGFDVITCNKENGGTDGGLVVHELKHTLDMAEFIQQNVFQFDKVFSEHKTNQDIYEGALKSIVDWIMSREGRATCFGYGQTGAGKTHTLLGDESESGVFFHAAKDILSRLNQQNKRPNQGRRGCTLSISLYEIYCSRIFDLLNNHKKLQALEDSKKQVHIHGLRSIMVQDMNSLQEVVRKGLGERSIGVTGANQDSSRSHAIVQLSIKDAKGVELSRLSFIDLAGSERASDALRDSDKRNRLEGAEINQSLLALKECIRSLDLALAHTPFRQSKLTQVLRDSFMGNSRTCMIANISPSHVSLEHTMNTLRYASRVKELHRRPATSTPHQQRNRPRVSSAKSSRQRPFTADPTYSKSRPSSAYKPRPQVSRSVSIDNGVKVMDYSAAFSGHGRELARTPPPTVTRSLSLDVSSSTSESRELPNESENIRLSAETTLKNDGTRVKLSTQFVNFHEANPPHGSNLTMRPQSRKNGEQENTKTNTHQELSNSVERINVKNRSACSGTDNSESTIELPSSNYVEMANHRTGRSSERGRTKSCSDHNKSDTNNEVNLSSSAKEMRRSSLGSRSSNESDISGSVPQNPGSSFVLGENSKNTNLPSPKKFLTFLKGKQSIKTKALRQQLKKARHRATSEHRGSEEESHSSDHSANSNSSTGAISTSHSNLTSNVQQHHQQRILNPDVTNNHSTPIIINHVPTPPLPSPKLDRSEPRRSSRISSRSASPGTGGRTTPDERQPTSSMTTNPSTKVGLTSATELRARLAAAAAALNSPSDSDDGKRVKIVSSRSKAVPKVSSSSDKENDTSPLYPGEAKLGRNEHVYRAQSEVVIAHQEHISEILRISIEEERLYHNLREQWEKGTSFETYTKSLVKLLSKKTQSIEALKVQLALYDRVRETYQSS